MQQTLYTKELYIIPRLIILFFIGAQIHILSISANPLIDVGSKIDVSNSTAKSFPKIDHKELSSSLLKSGAAAIATTMASYTIHSSNKLETYTSIVENFKTSLNATTTEGSSINEGAIIADTKTVAVATWIKSLPVEVHPAIATPSAIETPVITMDAPRTFRSKHHHEHHGGPFFEESLNSTIKRNYVISSAHLFTEAALNCRVGMLRDKTVMWVKRTTDKVSLLTVGNITYSGDPRIRVKFQYPNNWRLLINPIRKDDAGIYMCQVSTHPPKVFTTNLTVLEPPFRLTDEQDRDVRNRYYKIGSTIELKCQMAKSFLLKDKLTIPKSIQIYEQNHTKINNHKSQTIFNGFGTGHNELFSNTIPNNTKINRSMMKMRLNNTFLWTKDDETLPDTTTERLSTSEKWLTSRISIPNAKVVDSGNYKCSFGPLYTAIVQVLVLTGELPAAVQHNNASNKLLQEPLTTNFIGVYFICVFFSNTMQQISLHSRWL